MWSTGQRPCIIDGIDVRQVESAKFLGIYINANLEWKQHVRHICSKISKTTGLLCKARHYVPLGILRSLYHSLVYPYLYYGNICWGSYTYSTRLIRFNQKNPGKDYKINHVC